MNVMNRDVEGLLLIDKEAGTTSFQVVKQVRSFLGVKKVGHTGTLDPIATGVLPICIGRATKLASIIMAYTKEYDVWARLGVETDSHDRTGNVTGERPWDHITASQVESAIQQFVGEIQQVPPMFSAIKYRGRPLYWYAHKGIVFANRKQRGCTVHKFELLEWRPPIIRLRILASHGTYVRTLVHDLGHTLDSCASVDQLRRTACGKFHENDAIPLTELLQCSREAALDRLLTMSEALPELPSVCVDALLARRIRAGRMIMWSDLQTSGGDSAKQLVGESKDDMMFKLTDAAGSLLAVASLAQSPFVRQTGMEQRSNRVVRTLRIFDS